MQPSISFGINDWRNQLLDLDCTCQVKCIASCRRAALKRNKANCPPL